VTADSIAGHSGGEGLCIKTTERTYCGTYGRNDVLTNTSGWTAAPVG